MKNANPVCRSTFALVLVALTAVAAPGLVGCAKEKAANMLTVAATSPKGLAEYFPIKVGGKAARMQLAVREGEMQRGLMERKDLGTDDGMIFVYEKPQQMSFWMRNTPTALDIGFFNTAGVLEEIYPLHPFDEKSVASRSSGLQFALEMKQGWFQANGVKPGAQLDRKALAEALRERGFNPRKFGLTEGK